MADKIRGWLATARNRSEYRKQAVPRARIGRASQCRQMAPDARFPRLGTLRNPFMSSLFDAVEMAPRDPILGLNEQFVADPNPAKVNLGVGVYYDENGKLPLLRCVREAEKHDDGSARRRAATCRSTASPPTTRRPRRSSSAPTRGAPRRPDRDRPGGRRHRRAKIGADLLQRLNPSARGPDQRAELGEPPRAVRRRRLRGRHLSLLRRRARRASTSTAMLAALAPPRPERSSSCTPAATTRPAAT